jgi:hypothetical protein
VSGLLGIKPFAANKRQEIILAGGDKKGSKDEKYFIKV